MADVFDVFRHVGMVQRKMKKGKGKRSGNWKIESGNGKRRADLVTPSRIYLMPSMLPFLLLFSFREDGKDKC